MSSNKDYRRGYRDKQSDDKLDPIQVVTSGIHYRRNQSEAYERGYMDAKKKK